MATAEAKIQMTEFTNEPFVDFSQPQNRKAMEDALKKVASEFGREYPMYIGGQKVITTAKRTSTNPSHPTQIFGIFQEATADHANQAVEAAYKAFDSWKRVPAEKRVEILAARIGHHSEAQIRDFSLDLLRGRQVLGRSRRRHRRNHRLP